MNSVERGLDELLAVNRRHREANMNLKALTDWLEAAPEIDIDRLKEIEVAVAQAVEFAEYVEGAAKGAMVERARHFLSLPYAQELAVRLQMTANARHKPRGEAESA